MVSSLEDASYGEVFDLRDVWRGWWRVIRGGKGSSQCGGNGVDVIIWGRACVVPGEPS